MRIAVSSSTFRRPLEAGELTQLEWVERCASELGADGVVTALSDFPRLDDEYVAQLRKVAIDLGMVPFGIDAPGLLDPAGEPAAVERAVSAAKGFGAAVIRTAPPAPGEVPPATFAETVRAGKALARAAKAANITVLVTTAPGTIGEDVAAVRHLLKDIDSAWLRPCPPALLDAAEVGPRDRFPAVLATAADDPGAVAERASSAWVILDAPAGDRPWAMAGDAVTALRRAEARRLLETR
ncbi:MAG TPA: TIM barrel protein [Candidatus Elarobacter sp.]